MYKSWEEYVWSKDKLMRREDTRFGKRVRAAVTRGARLALSRNCLK